MVMLTPANMAKALWMVNSRLVKVFSSLIASSWAVCGYQETCHGVLPRSIKTSDRAFMNSSDKPTHRDDHCVRGCYRIAPGEIRFFESIRGLIYSVRKGLRPLAAEETGTKERRVVTEDCWQGNAAPQVRA